MRRGKKTLYSDALKKFGKDGLFRKSAMTLNDLSMLLLEKISSKEPVENDEDFFNYLAAVYISVQRLIEMLDDGPKERLWTTVHHQLDELKELVDHAD
jgi:hypothetical protein